MNKVKNWGWRRILLLILPLFLAFEYGDDIPFPPELCTLEFKNADIKNALRSLAKPYRVNLLVSDSVKGNITATFKDVYIRDAFLSILKDNGLGYLKQGDIVQVDSIINLQKKVPLVTKTFQLNYAFDSSKNKDLTELAAQIKKMLGKRLGTSITVMPRNNTIIVTDIQENVDRISRVIEEVDVLSLQVAITSTIIEINSEYVKELGIQWGGEAKKTFSHDPKSVTVQGSPFASVGSSGERFVVDLPAQVGPGAGGAINFIIGKTGGNILELQLSAMEKLGNGKKLANPKVITQNNQAAKIESGFEIPYQVIEESGGYKIEFKKAVISLDVTPHVIGKKIFMDLLIKKDSPDFSVRFAAGAPAIVTNQLTTKVLVENGETVVIGGLLTQDKPESENRVPWLADIPILGWLFKNVSNTDTKKELMIFITPNMIERG